jgi:hypothetical protein
VAFLFTLVEAAGLRTLAGAKRPAGSQARGRMPEPTSAASRTMAPSPARGERHGWRESFPPPQSRASAASLWLYSEKPLAARFGRAPVRKSSACPFSRSLPNPLHHHSTHQLTARSPKPPSARIPRPACASGSSPASTQARGTAPRPALAVIPEVYVQFRRPPAVRISVASPTLRLFVANHGQLGSGFVARHAWLRRRQGRRSAAIRATRTRR